MPEEFRPIGQSTAAHTPEEFNIWFRDAVQGDWCEYWRGLLMYDRLCEAPYAREQAGLIWKLYEQRLLTLVQARVGFADYLYLAKRV